MRSFVTVAFYAALSSGAALSVRSVAGLGGWSLSVGTGTCPAGSSTCFSNQTGLLATDNRLNNCCPSGTTPRLDCGTYVNTGQPYACCPLNNPDCRGDVEKTVNSSVCANSGWALWYIPDGGYNSFCCLPGQYGYWYKSLGQDAVGQCSNSATLPKNATPGTQVNNGDGTVSNTGVQLVPIIPANQTCDGYGICKSTTAPAPTCDVIHYGWSLQTNTSTCTAGANLCHYQNSTVSSCCPVGLSCGTVVGDSEVAPCCPPGNPDCRGDVEGLWPQLCADSSWSLWHVNENGNHFCCKPGEVGYNRIHDVYATGLCGNAVPRNTNTTVWMRSILDYVGDGSVAGSHLSFPCDSNPAPNATIPAIANAILNPPAWLNPVAVTLPTLVEPLFPNVTISYLPTVLPTAWGNSPYKPGNPGNPVGTGFSGSLTGSTGEGSIAASSGGSGSTTVGYGGVLGGLVGSGSTGSSGSGSGESSNAGYGSSSGSGSTSSGSSVSGSSDSGSSSSGSSSSGSSSSGSSSSGSSSSGSSSSGSSSSGSSSSGSSSSGSSSSSSAGSAGSSSSGSSKTGSTTNTGSSDSSSSGSSNSGSQSSGSSSISNAAPATNYNTGASGLNSGLSSSPQNSISTVILYETTIYKTICSTGSTPSTIHTTTSHPYSTRYITISIPIASPKPSTSVANVVPVVSSPPPYAASGFAPKGVASGTAASTVSVVKAKITSPATFTSAAKANSVGGLLVVVGFAALAL